MGCQGANPSVGGKLGRPGAFRPPATGSRARRRDLRAIGGSRIGPRVGVKKGDYTVDIPKRMKLSYDQSYFLRGGWFFRGPLFFVGFLRFGTALTRRCKASSKGIGLCECRFGSGALDACLAMVTKSILTMLSQGTWNKIIVCSVETVVAVAMRAKHTRDVHLSRESYFHIRDQHPDVSLDDLEMLLPDAINHGLVIVEKKRPHFATICYQSTVEGRRYAIALKSTMDGREIFIQSVHRMHARQTKAVLDRGVAVRLHQ